MEVCNYFLSLGYCYHLLLSTQWLNKPKITNGEAPAN